jgi:hypothetical protein
VRTVHSPWKNGERTITFEPARAYGVRLYLYGDEVHSTTRRATLALAMRDAHAWGAESDRKSPSLEGIAALFAKLTDAEREQIASDYCRECWREGNGCQCSNDE